MVFLFEQAEGIGQAPIKKSCQGIPFRLTAQDLVPPLLRVVNVGIGGCDIEIAEHNEFVVALQQIARESIEFSQPFQFVGKLVRADLGTVGDVKVQHADVINLGAQHALLHIFIAGQGGI